MRFYFDNTTSFRIAEALAILLGEEHVVSHPEAMFGDPSIPDEVFLPKLKADGDWIVITADRGKKDGNWHVWLGCGLTVVFLKKGWNSPTLKLPQMASKLLGCWSNVVHEVDRHPTGTCFYLSTTGRVERVPRKHHNRRHRA